MTRHAKFPDEYFTVGEVAKMMRCSIPTIYRWIRKGDFPQSRKFGGSSRWSLNEVREFLEQKRTNTLLPKVTLERSTRPIKRAKRIRRRKRD